MKIQRERERGYLIKSKEYLTFYSFWKYFLFEKIFKKYFFYFLKFTFNINTLKKILKKLILIKN